LFGCFWRKVLAANHSTVRRERRIKIQLECDSVDGKSVRKPGAGHTPPSLFGLRNRIYVQPVRTVLVRRGNRPAADAGRRRGLPVPGLLKEDGQENTIILQVLRGSSVQRIKFAARILVRIYVSITLPAANIRHGVTINAMPIM
jgi:hypothetical protein